MSESTIAAIATAPGMGAIATIRVSGSQAFEYTDKIFKARKGKSLISLENAHLYMGDIVNGDQLIDEVMLARFKAPHSYTGENCVEISCHGSVYIQQQILQLLIKNGCELAGPGEFTQRAFLNGKMDLSQAEAVADLIASSSAGSHRLAMNQMKGAFSKELNVLRGNLLNFVSLIELELDFSEEDVEFADRKQLKETANKIINHINDLVISFDTGNAIKNGVPVAIIGATNAGKSTLLNLLLKDDRAIVSDIHGTTRDVIEDTMVIHGILFRFIDTAGIRETSDSIESLGIERSFKKLNQADIVLWVIDALSTDSVENMAQKIIPHSANKQIIVLLNKQDSANAETLQNLKSQIKILLPESQILNFSAKYATALPELEHLLADSARIPNINNSDIIVTNVRHYEALQKALTALKRVANGLDTNISGDFLAQDIRECMHFLGEITGQISTDEVLGNIFSKFCIGK